MRLCTVLSWALPVSLQNRNAFILDVGDVFFRLLLFLPLGASYSLDSLRSSVTVTRRARIVSPGSVAFLGGTGYKEMSYSKVFYRPLGSPSTRSAIIFR
jgi:hypothetical protein